MGAFEEDQARRDIRHTCKRIAASLSTSLISVNVAIAVAGY
jgi:hypothetical protein